MHAAPLCLPLLLALAPLAAAQDAPKQDRRAPVVLTADGAWCWYQDERVIVDTEFPGGPLLLLSTVSFGAGSPATGKGDPEHGDIDVHWYQPTTGERGSFELHDRLQADDHDSAALWIRPDGRYLAVYTRHSSDTLVRWRITERPHDPTAWRAEQTADSKSRVCYSNLFWLRDGSKDGGRLYDFCRSEGFDPNYFVSPDLGESFHYGGKLHTGPDGNDARGQRPYVKYAAEGHDAVHFITTDGHPRNEDNSVYHGVLRGGSIQASDGSHVGDLAETSTSLVRSPDLTTVLASGTRFDGVAMRHAWTIDLHVDPRGNAYAALSARTARGDGKPDDTDHRFLYARWREAITDPDAPVSPGWQVFDIAKAGGYLYERENDYTGLVALHPHDANQLVISTPIDPRDHAQLQHYELFWGRTEDAGTSWTWAPLTWNSEVDNLRPVIPLWDADHTAILWLRGGIDTYTAWDAEVVCQVVATDRVEDLFVPGQDMVTRSATPAGR